jgi:LysR family transcriptional regulator, transcriptional activator of the cysJI operon
MENFRLKVFRTVAEKCSFRHAAEALYLTPPAVTLQIKALENDLGLQLFDRRGKAIVLTEAGTRLLKHAEQIATIVFAARQELAQLKGPDNGVVKVGASTTIAQYVLPGLIGEFVRAEPGIQVSVLSGNTDKVAHDLLEGDVAIGLVEGPIRQPLLKMEPFLADEVAIIVSAQHKWANQKNQKISLEQLAAAPLIFREAGAGTRRVVELALHNKGVSLKKLNVAMQFDSTEAIKAAVEAGLGIGFVSRRAISKELALGTLKDVTVEALRFQRDFSIIYPRGPEPSGPVGAFLVFLRAAKLRRRQLRKANCP